MIGIYRPCPKLWTWNIGRYHYSFGFGHWAIALIHYANVTRGGFVVAWHFGNQAMTLMASKR